MKLIKSSRNQKNVYLYVYLFSEIFKNLISLIDIDCYFIIQIYIN